MSKSHRTEEILKEPPFVNMKRVSMQQGGTGKKIFFRSAMSGLLNQAGVDNSKIAQTSENLTDTRGGNDEYTKIDQTACQRVG